MPGRESEGIVYIGVGNAEPKRDLEDTSINLGEHERSRHNLGLESVMKFAQLVGMGEMQIEKTSINTTYKEEYAKHGADYEGQLWVASAHKEVQFDDGSTMPITVVFPGPGINMSLESLQPWLDKHDLKPSQIILVTDDVSQTRGTLPIIPGGPLEHKGAGPIIREYCGIIPVVRIGATKPPEGYTMARTPYRGSEETTDDVALYLHDLANDLAAHRRRYPVEAVLPANDPLKKGAFQTLEYWNRFTADDMRGLQEMREKSTQPVLGSPLFEPSAYVDLNIYNTGLKLNDLAVTLLAQYKNGDPAVTALLERTIGQLDPTLAAWYRHPQFAGATEISLGPDTCWDFMIDPRTGVAYLLEGDRNGGGRSNYLLQARFHLNRVRPGLGDEVQAAQLDRMQHSIAKEYAQFCERTGKEPKERPTLILLHADHKMQDEKKMEGNKWQPADKPLENYFSQFDTHEVSEKHLRVDGERLLARTEEGEEVEVDMVYHLVSPAMMSPESYFPVIQAQMDGKIQVHMVGDPAKDLIYLNKPLYAAMSNLDVQIGRGQDNTPQSIRGLFGIPLINRLPPDLDPQTVMRVAQLYETRQLQKALREGAFGGQTEDIQAALSTTTTHEKLLKLIRELQPIIPKQTLITPDNVDELGDWVVNHDFYVKGDGLRDYGGRTTADPQERKRKDQIMKQVKREGINAVAQPPLNSLQHPLSGMKVETRWWGYTDRSPHQNKEIELHSRDGLFVRASAADKRKVDLKSGGETVMIRY